MKTFLFILGIILHILILEIYYYNKAQFNDFIYYYTPRRYPLTRNINLDSGDPILLSNEDFSYIPRTFDIDDTIQLLTIGLICTPISFGFNKEEADILFPRIEYPDCSGVTGVNKSSLYIDREKGQIYMTCPGNSGNFYYGPYNQYTMPRISDTQLKNYMLNNGPVSYKDIEFGLGLGECKGDKIHFMHAVLEPSFKEIAYDNAKKKIKDKERPIIIYFLTIDSFTRRHFFRKLPKTVEFFNNLKVTHPAIAIYDFKMHSTYGLNSMENQIPILGLRKNYVKTFKGKQFIDKLGIDAIWNILREKGYISLMGIDGCGFAYPDVIGRNPNVDYSVRQFYCFVQKKTTIDPDSNFKDQRCIGPHMNHYYLLNYTNAVARLNQGVNQ